MNLTPQAQEIYAQVRSQDTKSGELKKIAKVIKRDHALAMELWGTGEFKPRQLAVLIMDKKLLTQELIDALDQDMQVHAVGVRNQLADWLMANQLMKDKRCLALIQGWENSPSAMQRRIFWYHQARLRWTGQEPPANTAELLAAIEERMADEVPEVQWAMNFTAAWIGIFDTEQRAKCIAMGEKVGLYKDEVVRKGCTPNYLPEFIRIEVGKRSGK